MLGEMLVNPTDALERVRHQVLGQRHFTGFIPTGNNHRDQAARVVHTEQIDVADVGLVLNPHRLGIGVRVDAEALFDAVGLILYQGAEWNVVTSSRDNDVIQIRRNNNTQNINWRTSEFTIVRMDTAQDYDAREGAAPGTGFGAEREIRGCSRQRRPER